MKTIEEKARAYDSIIEKANKMHSENCEACKAYIEELIPELAESEDEKIRKWIVDDITFNMNNEPLNNSEYRKKAEKAIAWLEKQGEKDILEDCILDGNEDGLIAETIRYKKEKQDKQKEINLVEILKHYPKETELYSPLYGKLWLAEVDEKNEIITCYKHHLEEGCTRAVLEQEDTVSFYSNGTTGLPDFNISKDCMLFLYDIEKQGEKNPAWSEEDEVGLGDALLAIKQARTVAKDENDMGNLWYAERWLKSLKGKVQPKQEWSKEDDGVLLESISVLQNNGHWVLADKLKSLKPQNNITDEEFAQAKKNAYNNALDKIEYHSGEPTFDDGWSAAIDYIQKKSIRPQNKWKPSDEQMEALDWQVENTSVSSWQYKATKELMEDLKKLKEDKYG